MRGERIRCHIGADQPSKYYRECVSRDIGRALIGLNDLDCYISLCSVTHYLFILGFSLTDWPGLTDIVWLDDLCSEIALTWLVFWCRVLFLQWSFVISLRSCIELTCSDVLNRTVCHSTLNRGRECRSDFHVSRVPTCTRDTHTTVVVL